MSFDMTKMTSNGTDSFSSPTENATLPAASSQTFLQNQSVPEGCITVIFSEMEFIPWNNPDTVVSAHVEEISRRVKDFILVICFLIGGPGNVINMAVFYKHGFKDRVNLCLFALGFADEVYLITAMCHFAEQVHLQFTTSERYGPMITFLTNNHFSGLLGSQYASYVLTAIIASERCYCVLEPLKYQTLMRARTMAVFVVLVYIVVVGLYFIVAFRFHVGCIYDPVSGAAIKTATSGDIYTSHKELVDSVDSFVFGLALPGIVMTVVITATVVTIVKLRQIVSWRSETSSSISSREVALTKMLVGTSILFIACVFPFAITRISWQFFPEINTGRRNHNLFLTTLWINEISTYINASFNIVVYYIMGSRYRETFRGFFSKRPRASVLEGKSRDKVVVDR